jgi:hypothetical protein
MNQDEKAAMIEQELLKTQFPLECEEIPLEALSQDERIVVIKCMDHMDLTDDEFTLLKATLEKYRGAITKYRPTETVEAMENTVKIINTEKEFLDILNDESNKKLRVHLTYQSQVYEFNFEILPVDNSRISDYMEMNIDLFKDYSEDEKNIFNKSQEKKPLTPEEQIIVEKMTKDINAIAGEERAKLVDGFLASQLRLPESSQDYDNRLLFWKKFPFMEKWAIVQRVEEKLGLTEKSNEELFPVD